MNILADNLAHLMGCAHTKSKLNLTFLPDFNMEEGNNFDAELDMTIEDGKYILILTDREKEITRLVISEQTAVILLQEWGIDEEVENSQLESLENINNNLQKISKELDTLNQNIYQKMFLEE